jgi:predicted component of type VI protein secretion system
MAIERRGSQIYYYRKRRIGSQVRSTYVGAGALALQAYEADIAERVRRKARQAEHQRQIQLDREFAEVAKQISKMIRETLHTSGFHSHKGQWRKRRK